MLDFSYYLQTGQVRKRTQDPNLAKNLLKTAKDRLQFSKSIEDTKPKFAMESAYESVRELIDSVMAFEGYKTVSHEVAISFLQNFKEFSRTEIERLDLSRKRRNASKYYAAEISKNEAAIEIQFLSKIFEKLEIIIKKRMK